VGLGVQLFALQNGHIPHTHGLIELGLAKVHLWVGGHELFHDLLPLQLIRSGQVAGLLLLVKLPPEEEGRGEVGERGK
jgi:hypothetical protein